MNAVQAPSGPLNHVDTATESVAESSVKTLRILSIDAFRGLTILVMIFVNTLSGVHGMPAWLEHAPAEVDGMTFVDVVFPAFLFIVGMSIPFALAQREAKGDTPLQLWKHVGFRAFGLIVLGVFMVNAEEGYNEQAMHMSIYLWSLLFYGCVVLIWSVQRFNNKWISPALRVGGAVGLIALACIFRGGEHGDVYLAPQWWGILGLIGWAYLITCVLYRVTKGRLVWLLLAVAFCSAYYCLGHIAATKDSALLQLLLSQSDDASHSSIALCGLITSLIFFEQGKAKALSTAFKQAAGLVIALLIAGYFLRPEFRISKIYATPTWCLYSAATCVVLFALLYWLVDIKKIRSWTAFFKPAAANPLLTYIIPFVVYAWMQYMHWSWPEVFRSGIPGLIYAISFAVAVMAAVIGLNRLHIKLQL